MKSETRLSSGPGEPLQIVMVDIGNEGFEGGFCKMWRVDKAFGTNKVREGIRFP